MKYIAFVTKGLEEISEEEIKSLEGVTILSRSQKILEFEYNGELSKLKSLRTIDDIGIYILKMSVDEFLRLDLKLEYIKDAIEFLKKYRDIEENFSLTISKYKNKDINEEQLKEILSLYFSKNLGFSYTPLDHSNLDIRVNITEEDCLITLKLFPKSMFRRDYNHETQLGSLRSTIASAMLYKLIGKDGNLKVVDNFCGSGTFLCEALFMGTQVYGNDIDKNAVEITLKNLNKIKKNSYQVTNYDASKTKWGNDSFDIAVSNFPWDKQIKVHKMSKLIDSSIKEYSRILKQNSRIGLISTKPEIVIKYLKKYFEVKNIEMFKIGYLGQVPTIVLANIKKL